MHAMQQIKTMKGSDGRRAQELTHPSPIVNRNKMAGIQAHVKRRGSALSGKKRKKTRANAKEDPCFKIIGAFTLLPC